MIKLLRSFTTLSIILFLIALLVVYAFLPGTVGILFSDTGKPVMDIGRNTFFYSSLGIFLIIQLIFYLFNQQVLEKHYTASENRPFNVWFRGIILLINLFFVLMIVFTGMANNAQDYSYSSVTAIAYVGPVLIFLWIFTLPFFYLQYRKRLKSLR